MAKIFTEIVYFLGEFFQLAFTPLNPNFHIGDVVNTIVTLISAGFFVFWLAKILSLGDGEDKPYEG